MHNAELKRQERVKRRDIERRSVIDSVHVRLGGVDLLHPNHLERRQNRFHRQLRPGSREAVENTAVLVEESKRDGKRAQNNRVSPDQKVEEEIRTESTQNAVFALRCSGLDSSFLRDLAHTAILHQAGTPSDCMASPTTYMEPVMTTTPSFPATVQALLIAEATSAADSMSAPVRT